MDCLGARLMTSQEAANSSESLRNYRAMGMSIEVESHNLCNEPKSVDRFNLWVPRPPMMHSSWKKKRGFLFSPLSNDVLPSAPSASRTSHQNQIAVFQAFPGP